MAYVYLISVEGVVRYVGKGSGRRLHFHEGQARAILRGKAIGRHGSAKLWNKLAAAMRQEQRIEARILIDGLSDADAYAAEAEAIAAYEPDQLWNISRGGDNHARVVAAYAWALPGFREAHRERIRAGVIAAFAQSPGMQAGLQLGRDALQDPAVEARRRAGISAAKKGKPLSEATRAGSDAAWSDPDRRAIRVEAMSAAWIKPGAKELRSASIAAGVAKAMADPDKAALRKARMREAARKRWADPEKRASLLAARRG